MKKERKKDLWLLTYSDMVTLLLVFFILFVSVTKSDVVKTKIILTNFTGSFSFLNSGNSLEEMDNNFLTLGNIVQSLPSEEATKQKLNRAVDRSVFFFDKVDTTRKVRVIENREGIVISLFSDVFFEANSDKLNYDSVKEILEKIRKLIDNRNFKGDILINGHTDNVPYSGTKFKGNWELSMARALRVFDVLRQIPFIYPLDSKRVSIHAYGENRPIESNDTPEGRSYNRRVDIVLKR